MNYIELIKNFWTSHNAHSFSTTEIALYFYLIEVFNICQWKNQIKRNNRKVEADLDISFNTLKNARNRLQQAGLIYFKSQNGNANVTYTLSKFDEVTNEVGVKVTNEVSTRLVPSKDKLNKTKHKEIDTKKEVCTSSNTLTEFERYENWIKENAPYCYKNLKQLTEDNYRGLRQSYSVKQIADTILQIENRKDLRKKYSNLYRTLLNWLKNNRNETTEQKQSGSTTEYTIVG